jgi:hypothetical protein
MNYSLPFLKSNILSLRGVRASNGTVRTGNEGQPEVLSLYPTHNWLLGAPCWLPTKDLYPTSGYLWRSDTIRPCLQARVAAFGSQDLSFRTSIFGSQHLGFRTSINGRRVSLSGPGFQDLESSAPGFTLRTWVSGPRKLSILRPSYLFPVTFLCVHRLFSFSRHFSLRPVVTDGRNKFPFWNPVFRIRLSGPVLPAD